MQKNKIKSLHDIIDDKDILIYCLEEGMGIIYPELSQMSDCSTTDDEINKCMTKKPRYVMNEQIDVLKNTSRPEQLQMIMHQNDYPVLNYHLDYCDYEDWQYIQDIIGISLPYAVSKSIEDIIMSVIDDRVIGINAEIVMWERQLIENYTDFAETELNLTDSLLYLFGIEFDDKQTADISSAFDSVGINISKYVTAVVRHNKPIR